MDQQVQIININIGGYRFSTCRSTIEKSGLVDIIKLIDGKPVRDEKGYIFIELSKAYGKYIDGYIRQFASSSNSDQIIAENANELYSKEHVKPKKERPTLKRTFTFNSINGYNWHCPECNTPVRANKVKVIEHLVIEHGAQVPYQGCGIPKDKDEFVMYYLPED